jgi:hypothetical protein
VTYARATATAQRLVSQKGAALTITRTTPGTYSPTGGVSGSVVTTAVGNAVAKSPSRADSERMRALELIETATVILLVSSVGLAFAPTPGDTLAWSGATYTVRDVVTLAPNATERILYTVYASR